MVAGLLVIGLVLIASALKNTQHELGEQVQADILGTDGFLAWAGAILAIGAIGYIPGLRTSSRYLLLLLGTVMVVRNQGVFSQVQQALVTASAAGPAPAIPAPAISGAGTPGGAPGSTGDSSGGLGSAIGAISSIAGFL